MNNTYDANAGSNPDHKKPDHSTQNPLPIVILISGYGSNLQAIIDAIDSKNLSADIRAVISNKKDAYGLERAKKAGIPVEVVQHTDFENREAFDKALIGKIDQYQPGLVVLAGFMRILTEDFVNHYQGRMMNIHPSLLPKFQGLNTHARALAENEKIHGASVHFVTSDLDSGPIIIQAKVPVLANDNEKSLAERVHEQEHRIYPLAIQWFAKGRLCMKEQNAILDGHMLQEPHILQDDEKSRTCN